MRRHDIVTMGGLVAAMYLATAALPFHRAESAVGGKVQGRATIRKAGVVEADQSGVVVYLENLPSEGTNARKPPRMIRQINVQFDPRLSVVVKGSTVEFPNEDRVFHNIFSVSGPAKFDLGLYKSGTSKTVTFKHTGEVDIYCNIHPEMRTTVLVIDNAYYAITASDGSFEIPNVPPGVYPLVAWQPRGAEYRGEVSVTANRTTRVEIDLVQGKPAEAHLRKDGTPYGRYK